MLGYKGTQPSLPVAWPSLSTLAALSNGIGASKSIQMPKVAAHVPDGTKPESRVKRFASLVGNPQIPGGIQMGLLAACECAGTTLQQSIQDDHWAYGVRMESHITVMWEGETFRCDTVASCIKPGTIAEFTDLLMTQAAYGPVMLIGCGAKG
jgi:hypothetical protein